MAQLNLGRKSDIRKLRQRVEEKLSELESELGVTFRVDGSIKYGGKYATISKIEAMSVGEDGDPLETPEAATYKSLCGQYGLERSWLGKKIRLSRTKATIAGLDTRKHKYPVILEGEDGKRYKASANQVRTMATFQQN